MHKKLTIFLVITGLTVLALLLFFLTKKNYKNFTVSRELLDGGFHIVQNGVWEEISKESINNEENKNFVVNLPENMSGGNSQMYNQLLKGYFINYDAKNSYVVLRSLVPSTRKIYRDVKIAIDEQQLIYCWPSTLNGQDVKQIMFDLKSPQVIMLPEEEPILFSASINYLDNQSFFIVQLQHDVDVNNVNLTYKIAWLCK